MTRTFILGIQKIDFSIFLKNFKFFKKKRKIKIKDLCKVIKIIFKSIQRLQLS